MEATTGYRTAIEELEKTVFDSVIDETFRQAGKELEDWSEHLNNVIDALMALKPLDEPAKTNSLVVFRAVELFRELNWIQHSIIRGAYHSAIRDLRYLLEAMVQAFWIWTHHKDAEMGEKYPLIPERIDGRFAIGKTLLKDSGIPNWEPIHAVYEDLGKYVHPTKEELEPVLVRGRVDIRFTFCFDREMFSMTRALTSRAVDALLHIFFLRFPDAGKPFIESPFVALSLTKMKQTLTLNILRATAPPQSNKRGG